MNNIFHNKRASEMGERASYLWLEEACALREQFDKILACCARPARDVARRLDVG